MEVWRLRRLGSRVDHPRWLLMRHRVALMLMELRCAVRPVQSHPFRVLPVIVVAVTLLLLVLLLLFHELLGMNDKKAGDVKDQINPQLPYSDGVRKVGKVGFIRLCHCVRRSYRAVKTWSKTYLQKKHGENTTKRYIYLFGYYRLSVLMWYSSCGLSHIKYDMNVF